MNKIQILTPIPSSISYPKKAFQIIEKAEKHFWFTGRNEVIRIILNRFLKTIKRTDFIEIGCGNGLVLMLLEKLKYSITGLDIHMEGLKIARSRTNATLICADVYKFKSKKKYDAIGMFDVIEHIGEDERFLKKCGELLKPNGKIIITVPADMKLWSQMDLVSGHKRRYTKSSLINILVKLGYKIEFISYFNCLLYIPQLLFRKFTENKMKKAKNTEILIDQLRLPPVAINIIMKWLFLLEAQLLRITAIPFGASLIAVASKKED